MTNTLLRFDYNLNNDVRAAAAIAGALVPYIYENELYGALPGTLPRITVGGLIMRLNRLDAIRVLLTPDQATALDTAHKQFDAARKEWAVHYEEKLDRELTARIRMVSQAIRDWVNEPRRAPDVYPSDIEKRVMIEGLTAEAEASHTLTEQQRNLITGIDTRIRTLTDPSGFIWDQRLLVAYPKERYWYLYAEPRG
jgi:hypothetical protein